MNKVYLGLTGNAFCKFSKLPITSVDGMFVVIFETPDSWPKFYRAAKRLFADIENSGGTRVRFESSCRPSIDQTNWKNVTKLELDTLTIHDLICLTSKMPQVKMISAQDFSYSEIDDDVRARMEKSKSRLEHLHLYRTHLLDLIMSLRCLQKLDLEHYIGNKVERLGHKLPSCARILRLASR